MSSYQSISGELFTQAENTRYYLNALHEREVTQYTGDIGYAHAFERRQMQWKECSLMDERLKAVSGMVL